MRKSHLFRRGNMWKLVTAAAISPLFLAASEASAQNFAVSFGLRESNTVAPIGDNGGTANGIEFVNLDGQNFVLDGTWQQFTFNFQSDMLTAFAGSTANGMYDFTRGVLEHIRIRNTGGVSDPVTVWIDDIVNTVSGLPTVVSGFETTDPFPATVGSEHIFQEPGFSGSTSSFVGPGSAAAVTDQVARTGTQSYELNWNFINSTTTNWVRLTSFGAGQGQPNPTVDYTDGNSLSFWLRGILAPPAQRWLGPAGGGNWDDVNNWGTGVVPNGVAAIANFLEDATTAQTVTFNAPITVNTIRLKNDNVHTFVGDEVNNLTFDGGANIPRGVNVDQGNHTFNVPITLNMRDIGTGTFAEMFFNVARAQDVLTVNSDITYNNTSIQSATLTIQKQGPGRLDITNLVTNDPTAAPLRILVQQGTMRLIAGSGITRVNGASITGGSVPVATLDITNNPLVVEDFTAGTASVMKAQIYNAYNNGAWDLPGITSSMADANSFGVGFAEASELPSVPAVFGTIDGDAFLIRRVRYGDATMDGVVDLSDFNRLAANFGSTDADWFDGDFTYDRQVNLSDFNRLAANFGMTASVGGPTPDDWAALASAVPEPASLALVGLAALPLMRRRRAR